MEALGASDYSSIKSLFAEDRTVPSPFLVLMPAREFFDRLGGATKGNIITLIYDTHPIRNTAGNRYESRR